MEDQKVLPSLNEASNSKSVTRKWNIANDQSNANYGLWNEIIYNTEVLISNLCEGFRFSHTNVQPDRI